MGTEHLGKDATENVLNFNIWDLLLERCVRACDEYVETGVAMGKKEVDFYVA